MKTRYRLYRLSGYGPVSAGLYAVTITGDVVFWAGVTAGVCFAALAAMVKITN